MELEFDYPREKHKAERSWRSICIAFQAVLSTAVELRIALSDMPPEEVEAVRIGETMADIEAAGPSSSRRHTEIVTEDSNGDYTMQPGPSTAYPKHKEVAHDDHFQEIPGSSRPHRRRGTKHRKHRHATESLENDLHSPGGITPRGRHPPSRRRKAKRNPQPDPQPNPKPEKTVIPVREMRASSSSFGGGEIWDSGPQLIMMERMERMERQSGEKKPLSTMMEEPQSDIEDIRVSRKKIWEQQSRSARMDGPRPANLDRRTST